MCPDFSNSTDISNHVRLSDHGSRNIICSSLLSDEPAAACCLVCSNCEMRKCEICPTVKCETKCEFASHYSVYITENAKWFQDITFLIRFLYTRLHTAVFASSFSHFTLRQISHFRILQFALYKYPVSWQRPISVLTGLINCRWQTSEFV